MHKIFISLFLTILSANAMASIMFITPSDVASSTVARVNNGNALIENALDTSYIASNPSSGGNGTSTWHRENFNTWTFNFDDAYTLSTAYIWDYYGHSATEWKLDFFGDIDATGSNLGFVDFSLGPLASSGSSILHTVAFTDVSGVKSVTLRNTNQSSRGGVGLAEVHFGGVKASAVTVPEPSTLAIFALGMIGLASRRFKK